MPGSSNKKGRPAQITDDDLLEVFRSPPDPVLSTAEVAEAVPIKRRGTLNRLQDLEDRGALESKRIGGRNTVWWLVGEGGDAERERERAVTPSEETPDRSDPSPEARPEEPSTARQDAEEILRGLGLPGSGGKFDARIEATLGLYDHLREKDGEAVTRAELLELVDLDAVGYTSRSSFWTNFIKRNRGQGRDTNTLVALPGIEGWGDGKYRYTEP